VATAQSHIAMRSSCYLTDIVSNQLSVYIQSSRSPKIKLCRTYVYLSANRLLVTSERPICFLRPFSFLYSPLQHIYGRYSALQLSLLIFLIGSAISTGAVDMTMMLVGRGIAGIGGAGLLTVRLRYPSTRFYSVYKCI